MCIYCITQLNVNLDKETLVEIKCEMYFHVFQINLTWNNRKCFSFCLRKRITYNKTDKQYLGLISFSYVICNFELGKVHTAERSSIFISPFANRVHLEIYFSSP